jgi:hypothetical protein
MVLEAGLNVFVVDADWGFQASPFPWLSSVNRFDVVGWLDVTTKLANVGLLFLRSTAASRTLAQRVSNRTVVAWDQVITPCSGPNPGTLTPDLICSWPEVPAPPLLAITF